MDLFLLICAAAVALVSLGTIALSFSPKWLEGRARALVEKLGLRASPDFVPQLLARVARRIRFSSAGGIGGVVIGAALMQTIPSEGPVRGWLLAGCYLAGSGAGAAIGVLGDRVVLAPGSTRIARASVATLADFSAPLERIGARVATAGAIALVALTIALRAGGVLDDWPATYGATAITAVLATIGLLAYEIVGRRIVAQSRLARTEEELAWDDGLRSHAITDLAVAPLTLGAWSVVSGGLVLIVDGLSAIDPALSTAAVFLILLAALPLLLLSLTRTPRRHFLRRLWPQLAAGTR